MSSNRKNFNEEQLTRLKKIKMSTERIKKLLGEEIPIPTS